MSIIYSFIADNKRLYSKYLAIEIRENIYSNIHKDKIDSSIISLPCQRITVDLAGMIIKCNKFILELVATMINIIMYGILVYKKAGIVFLFIFLIHSFIFNIILIHSFIFNIIIKKNFNSIN